MTDLGLFGPDSVTWRVNSDPVLSIAGLRALLLQSLHPRAMAGVSQHSDFRADPWGRLFRTGEYIATVSFGSTEEAQQAAERVRALHARLTGTDTETGETFRIDEPDLLRWVHVTEIESFVSTVRRSGAGLSRDDVNRYYAEQRQAAELIGIDPLTVPASDSDVTEYYRQMQPELRLTPEAVGAAAFLLWPPMPRKAAPVRPAWAGLFGLGFALLPGWARRRYGAPGLPTTGPAATMSLRALRATLLALPRSMREGPRYTEAKRRAAARGITV